jgi:hypothetical protein
VRGIEVLIIAKRREIHCQPPIATESDPPILDLDERLLRINNFHQLSTTSTGNQRLSHKLTLERLRAILEG